MFYREICEVTLFERRERLGRPGRLCRSMGRKQGKENIIVDTLLKASMFLGGIEQYSQKCLIVTVEDRTEATLVSHIHEWVEPGTTIVHDCWKDYVNLEKYGYEHKTVNHSVEFVNSEGYDTNKIEGHWR